MYNSSSQEWENEALFSVPWACFMLMGSLITHAHSRCCNDTALDRLFQLFRDGVLYGAISNAAILAVKQR